ncbi:hypothetical protein GGI35DRAFT_328212 [Trichoderma velutinum]
MDLLASAEARVAAFCDCAWLGVFCICVCGCASLNVPKTGANHNGERSILIISYSTCISGTVHNVFLFDSLASPFLFLFFPFLFLFPFLFFFLFSPPLFNN